MSWQPHPQQPGFYFNAQGQIAHHSQLGLPAPVAAPAYAPPAQPAYAAPQQPPQTQYAPAPQAYGAPPQQQGYAPGGYGMPAPVQPVAAHGQFGQGALAPATKPTPQFVEAANTSLPQTGYNSSKGGEVIWLDLPQVTTVGQTVSILVRFLPALTEQDRFVTLLEHKMPIEFEVAFQQPGQQRKPSQKRSFYVLCPEFGTGPGNCTICGVRKNLTGEKLEQFKGQFWARKRYRHQALNMSDPNVHWVQAKDENGNPRLDAYGQPQWTIQPGVFALGAEPYGMLTNASRNAPGPIDSRDRGVLMQISKTKTGAGMNEVSYYVERGQEFPLLGSPFQPVLDNIFPLRARLERYRSADEMLKLAELIKQKLGVTGASYSMPSAGMPSFGAPGMPAQSMGMPIGMPMPTPGMPMQMAAPAPSWGAPPAQPAYQQPAQAPQFAQPAGYPQAVPQQPYAPPQQPYAPPQQPPQYAPQGAPSAPQFSPQVASPQFSGQPGQQVPQGQPYQPPTPPPVAVSQLPHVTPMAGALPPPTAPGLAHAHLPPIYAPPPQQYAPQPGQPPQQQPQYAQQAPQQSQQPQQYAQGPAPMSTEELERVVTPSGGSIPF